MLKVKPAVIKKVLIKNSPQILTGIGIVGMVTAAILAVHETPKALKLIEEEKKEQKKKELTKTEVVQTTWKCYVRPVGLGLISIGCVVGGQRESLKRTAALATAYSLSEAAFKEYREKNIELFGEKKDKEVYGKIAEDKVAQNPPKPEKIIATGKGDSLFYDPLSDRYFYFSIDKMEKVENRMNKRLISEMYISLNDIYKEIPNLGPIGDSVGEGVGWSVDKDMISIDYSPIIVPDGPFADQPCIVLRWHIAPRNDYMANYA